MWGFEGVEGLAVDVVSGRGERFARDVEALKVRDPSVGRPVLWLRLGVVLMVLGVVVVVVAFFVSHSTTDALVQRDGIVLGLGGVVLGVVGSAVYVRFALTNFLRFWLARQSFDLQVHTDRLVGRSGEMEVSG